MSARPAGRNTREAVERLGAEEMSSREFRAAVLDRLNRDIGFDWYAWVVTDPFTSVGVDPLADLPDLSELPQVIRLKYLTPTNRWTSLDPIASLDDHASDSLLWRDIQCVHGVVDVASVVFRDPYGCWAFLDLWSKRAYGADALQLLRDLAPALTRCLRQQQARTFDVVAATEHPAAGPVVLLLDDDLRVVGQTPTSGALLGALLPSPEGADPIPACALNVAAQLVAQEHGIDDHDAMARVHLADGFWVTLQASRVAPSGLIAVTIEPSSPGDRLDLFSRAAGLSRREHELLAHLAQGSDTKDAASLMFLSENTIQDHLKSIFAKTRTHSRRVLLSHALGFRAPLRVTGF